LVHLQPVEDARLDRLDQVGGLELRVVDRVAADEGGALEDDVVQLATATVVRADRADERAGAQPLTAQDRIARRGRGYDDVARGGILVALPRLGAVLLAERAQPLLRPAIGDDALDLRHRGLDAGELRLRLPPAPDHAEAGRTLGREVPRRDAARRTGAQLPELVRLEHRDELRRVGTEEKDGEARSVAKARIDLGARVTELEIGGGHDRERSLLETQPV